MTIIFFAIPKIIPTFAEHKTQSAMTERHPLKPFLPTGAKILMLGSFPPPMKRWKMPFYYPNFQNDMWRIFGIVFFNDINHFIDLNQKCFKQQQIVDFLTDKGIAIYDTAVEIERGNNDASDANINILERVNLAEILSQIPDCKTIVSTDGKSAEVVSEILGVFTICFCQNHPKNSVLANLGIKTYQKRAFKCLFIINIV